MPEKSKIDRMYGILAGLLFEIDLLNIFMTREDYPSDLLGDNEIIVNIVNYAREVHRDEHITLTWNRFKDLVSRTINSPVDTLDDCDNAQIYYTIWEKCELLYIEQVKDKEYSQKWRAELKWLIENYIAKRCLWNAKQKAMMLKKRCFAQPCDKACDMVKYCKECKKFKSDKLSYIMDWHDIAEQKLRTLRQESQGIRVISYGENVEERIKRYEDEFAYKQDGNALLGLSTGIPVLDSITDGFIKGHIMAILGRTGQGKSALALQMAIDSWMKTNQNYLFINLEIPIWDIQKRLDTSTTGTKYDTVRRGLWKSEDEFQEFKEKLRNNTKKNKFVVHDAYDLNITGLDKLLRGYYNQWGSGFVVILDNLNRMSFPNGMKRHEGGNAICVKYHKLIKEFDACGVLVAQLNRSAEGINRTGMLNSSHVRESDQLLDSVSSAFAIVDYLGKQKKRVLPMKGRDFDMDIDIILKNDLHKMRLSVIEEQANEISNDFSIEEEEVLDF